MRNDAGHSTPRIGSYELVTQVATSPTGSVWLGRDPALDRRVAVKQVAAGAVQSVERLRTEARVLARLSHPNIVAVIDLLEADGQLWLVEEWVDGLTLPAVLRNTGRFTPTQAVGAVRGGLLGLAYAHRNGIVHGDVSPSNMLLDLRGTTKLIDFGLAQPSGVAGVAGTPGYLSPEAASGRPLVPASDVYSAAAVLALLLRGQPLFEGATAEAVLAAQFRPGEPPLSGIDPHLRSVLRAALTPSAADRPDAGQFLAALDGAAERAFGPGWLASAGLAAAVGAAATAGVSVAIGSGAGAGLSAQAPVATPSPAGQVSPARPGPYRLAGRSLRQSIRSHALAVGAAAAGIAVAVGAVAVAVQSSHGHKTPGRPIAGGTAAAHAAPISTSPTSVAPSPASFDLRSVDWKNVTVPGRACFSKRDITLRNGTAAIPIPSVTPPGGYQLKIEIPPQYGQLGNGGPPVAVVGLLCAGTGSYSGTGSFWHSVVVFDGQGGRPHVLGLFTGADLGTVGSLGVWLQPRQLQVGNGVVTVTGLYLQPSDAHCCPSGHGTTTISYRNGRLVPSRVISTTTAPGSASSGPTAQPSAAGVGRTITATTPSGHTYVATVQAEDVVSNCAAHSYGTPVIDYFRQHPCPRGAGRRLVTIPFEGRTVALSMIEVDAQVGPPGDLYRYAAQLNQLERAAGTGGLDDMLRSGTRPAGWPAAIPPDEAFVVTGEDDTVDIFDAWYLTGPTANQDPTLSQLVNDLFLTPITLGPF
jgi:serine/threonine-protein kinase